MRVVLAAVAVVALGSLPVVAQSSGKTVTKPAKAWTMPRTPDGAPDLTGNWTNATYTPLERPANMAGKEFFTAEEAEAFVKSRDENFNNQAADDIHYDNALWQSENYKKGVNSLRTSLIVDPANGMLPPLVPVAQARKADRPKRSFDDPETFGLAERCLLGNFGASGGSLASPPMVPSVAIPSFYRIVQTDTHVLIFAEWVHDARIIRLNGTHLPLAVRSWLGDSIGHYDGQTLVVDTTNFRREVHNLNSGERLHVVERFTRVDARTLRYRVTVDDPDTWATPWVAEWSFKSTEARMFPVECHEGNYAVENFLRGARAEEKRR